MTPLSVGREASVRALEEALAATRRFLLSTQHDCVVDDPKRKKSMRLERLPTSQSVKASRR